MGQGFMFQGWRWPRGLGFTARGGPWVMFLVLRQPLQAQEMDQGVRA